MIIAPMAMIPLLVKPLMISGPRFTNSRSQLSRVGRNCNHGMKPGWLTIARCSLKEVVIAQYNGKNTHSVATTINTHIIPSVILSGFLRLSATGGMAAALGATLSDLSRELMAFLVATDVGPL